MSRKCLVIILILFSSLCCHNSKSNSFEITIVSNTVNHDSPDTLVEFIEVDSGAPDIYLFHKLFDVPRELPKSFSSTTHCDIEITSIYHPDDSTYKFKRVLTYDSERRVKRFAEFPCIISSSGGYNYFVTYNEKGQVVTIKDSVIQILSHWDRYELDYFENGDLKEIRKFGPYSKGGLPSKIITVSGLQ